jgi:hypothetical protein
LQPDELALIAAMVTGLATYVTRSVRVRPVGALDICGSPQSLSVLFRSIFFGSHRLLAGSSRSGSFVRAVNGWVTQGVVQGVIHD